MCPTMLFVSVFLIEASARREELILHRFDANDTIRYFSLVASPGRKMKDDDGRSMMMIAKRTMRRRRKGHDYLVVWRRCSPSSLSCLSEREAEPLTNWHMSQEANVAHNAAWFSVGDELFSIGGRDDPGRRGRDGVRYLGPARSHFVPVGPVAFRGSHPGCVERRDGFDRRCEFDGKFSVASFRGELYVYARANTVGSSIRGSFGGRHVQMATLDPSRKSLSSGFRPCTFFGYPDTPGARDNVYFGAVKENPVDPTTLIGLFPVVSRTAKLSCVAVAVSRDGLSFSKLTPLFESRNVDDGQRTVDHPVDGFVEDGDLVHFFIHAAVAEIADPLLDGPPRILRHSLHRDYLINFTKHSLQQQQQAVEREKK